MIGKQPSAPFSGGMGAPPISRANVVVNVDLPADIREG
jgi:hypothetical protein